MEWVRQKSAEEEIPLHKNWSTKSRCMPKWPQELDRVNKMLDAIEERAKKKASIAEKQREAQGLPRGAEPPCWSLGGWSPSDEVCKWTRSFEGRGTLSVEHVRKWKKEGDGLACTPLDKVSGEAVLL